MPHVGFAIPVLPGKTDLDRDALGPQRLFEPGGKGSTGGQAVAGGERISQRYDSYRPLVRQRRQDHHCGECEQRAPRLDRRGRAPI